MTSYRDLQPGDTIHLKWRGVCEYVDARDEGHDYCMTYTFRDGNGKDFDLYQRPNDPVYVLRVR